MELRRHQTRIEDLPLFAAAKPRPVSVPEPVNPRRTGVEWTEAMRMIWEVLRGHVGEASGITAPRIAREAGLWVEMSDSDRGDKVRAQIRVFLDELPWPVLAGSGGYYLAGTAEEIEHYDAAQLSRIRHQGARLAKSRRQARAAGFVYQGKGRWAEPAGGVRIPEVL